MHPVDFEGRNITFVAPEGVSEEECGELPVQQFEAGRVAGNVSCWQLSDDEISHIVKTKKVYLTVLQRQHPPVLLSIINPADESNKPLFFPDVPASEFCTHVIHQIGMKYEGATPVGKIEECGKCGKEFFIPLRQFCEHKNSQKKELDRLAGNWIDVCTDCGEETPVTGTGSRLDLLM